jgi:DNA-binding transcriptional LysR family regulator
MRLEQLQAFLTVAQMGSFQKAARLCQVTQSTVSRPVQGLETALGLSQFPAVSRPESEPQVVRTIALSMA